MSEATYDKNENRDGYIFDECPSKIDPELMNCGQVFLCFISEDFVFFCGLCKNATCKYTIFDEFANHVKNKHIMLSNDDPNDKPYKMCPEIQGELLIIDKKESAEEQALSEFEIDYLECDEGVDENSDEESLYESVELSQDDDTFGQDVLQPKEFVLQSPESQIIQFINLYREQECLWNVESKLYHKTKVKNDAYQEIIKKFNEFHPNALNDIISVKKIIEQLFDFFNEGKQQTAGISSNHEIHNSLLFLKNISKSRQVQFPKTTIDCCTYFEKNAPKTKSSHDSKSPNKFNNISINTLLSDCKICPICRVSFENSEELKIHLSDLSSNLKKNICNVCGDKFEDRSNFITHLRRHKKKKNFVCSICPKGFLTSAELELHTLVHNDKLQFLCETCGHRFRYPNHLETHKLLHGDPLFECNVCNAKFLQKRQLVYHQRKHGPKEMMVSCDICKNMYRNKDSLLRHERKIHNIRKRSYKNI